MLPLSSRALPGSSKNEPLQTRSLVIGMVLALLCAGVGYVARGDTGEGVLASTPAGTAAQAGGRADAGGEAPVDGDAPADDPTEGATEGATEGEAAAGDLPVGAQVPAGGGGEDGAAPTVAGGSSAPRAAGSRSKAAAGGGGEGPGSSPTPKQQQSSGQLSSGPLGPTDQGVTKDSIKLGFLIANTSQLSAAGFKAGVSGDQEKIIKAWTNEINRTGGVNGRTVTPVSQEFDVLSVDNQQAACKTMTRDLKVFSVLSTGGYDSVAQLCIAKENRTPFIGTDPEPAQWYQDAKPYLWATFMNKDRINRNKARWLKAGGYLRPSDKVGVIYHDIPNVAPSVEKTLLPELSRNGIRPVSVVKLASDSDQALRQVNNAVLEMRQKGVTFVDFSMNLIFKSQFMQVAEKQGYFPRYNDSDQYFGCQAFTTATYPQRSFDKTQCLTTTHSGQRKLYVENAFTKTADAVYKKTFPQGYASEGNGKEAQDGQRALNYSLGSIIALWHQAAVKSGTQLTRPLWGKAMQLTGTFTQQSQYCSMSFREGKFDGSDELAVVQFRYEASDGYGAKQFRTTKPCFDNYS